MPIIHDMHAQAARLRGDRDAWRAVSVAATEELMQFGSLRLAEIVPHDSGRLSEMLTHVGTEGEGAAWRVRGEVYAREEASAYAETMNDGRRPGARPPPTDAIALWVKRVIGLPAALNMVKDWAALARTRNASSVKLSKRGRLRKISKAQTPERIIKTVAYVVARSIGRKGIKPHHFFERTLAEIEDLMPDVFDRQIGRFLQEWP